MSAPKSSDPPTWKVKTDVGDWIWLVTAGLSLYLWPTTLVITSLTFKVKSFHFVCALNHIICSRLTSNCELPPPHHFSLLSYNFKCLWSFSFWHIWFQSNNSRPNSRTTKARVRGVVGGFPSPDDCVFLCTYLRVCSSQQKLCKACWPRGDQLHNGHHSNRLPKMSPFRAPQLWVCVCVCETHASVQASYLKIDTSSVSGETWWDWMWCPLRPTGSLPFVRVPVFVLMCTCPWNVLWVELMRLWVKQTQRSDLNEAEEQVLDLVLTLFLFVLHRQHQHSRIRIQPLTFLKKKTKAQEHT